MYGSVSCICTVSIHAPTKGATGCPRNDAGKVTGFNPRSHEGSDGCRPLPERNDRVSIHAPTKGATEMSKFINADPDLFQSTLPRRERQVIGFISGATDICFNPRSHEGSDETSRIHGRRLRVSIHAPTKGATFMEKYGKQGVKLFQSTLPRRERPTVGAAVWAWWKFQSTLPRRERLEVILVVSLLIVFQSTLPRRERRLCADCQN